MCSANVILLFRGWEFMFEVMNQGVIEEVVFNVSAAEQERFSQAARRVGRYSGRGDVMSKGTEVKKHEIDPEK